MGNPCMRQRGWIAGPWSCYGDVSQSPVNSLEAQQRCFCTCMELTQPKIHSGSTGEPVAGSVVATAELSCCQVGSQPAARSCLLVSCAQLGAKADNRTHFMRLVHLRMWWARATVCAGRAVDFMSCALCCWELVNVRGEHALLASLTAPSNG